VLGVGVDLGSILPTALLEAFQVVDGLVEQRELVVFST